MKSITCDFCQKPTELDSFQALPYGWSKYKLDSRVSGNIGGQVIRLDCCTTCAKDFKRDNVTKEGAVRIFREVMSGRKARATSEDSESPNRDANIVGD